MTRAEGVMAVALSQVHPFEGLCSSGGRSLTNSSVNGRFLLKPVFGHLTSSSKVFGCRLHKSILSMLMVLVPTNEKLRDTGSHGENTNSNEIIHKHVI